MKADESAEVSPIVRISKPYMPKGYLGPEGEGTLLPWEHARRRLEEAKNYWIASTRPDGRPHAVPVWGVWLDNKLYFDGSPETRRGRNIAHSPAVTVHLESGSDVIIVEGNAYPVQAPPRELTEQLAEQYRAKYPGYAPAADQWDEGGLYVVLPHIALGWDNFPENCTRWQFARD